MAIYIKFDGIDGEVEEHGHEKWVEVSSFHNAAHKGGGGSTGSQRVAGVTVFEDIGCSKNSDKTSPKLLEAMCVAKSFDKVQIHVTVSTEDGPQVVSEYELKHVVISSYQISGHGEGRPSENMSLNFEEIKFGMYPVDAKGKRGGVVEFGWSVPKAKKA